MRCSQSDRDGERDAGDRRTGEERVSSFLLLFIPRLFRALLTGGAWLVMSREVARLAGTNRLPPLIVYDVTIPLPSPLLPPLSLYHPSISCALSLLPSLPVFIASLWFIQGGVEVRAKESRGVFYCSRCVKRPTYSIPAQPALTCQDWLIHLEWPCPLCCTQTLPHPPMLQ